MPGGRKGNGASGANRQKKKGKSTGDGGKRDRKRGKGDGRKKRDNGGRRSGGASGSKEGGRDKGSMKDLAIALLNKARKGKEHLPELRLDRDTINRLQFILSEYTRAKRLLEEGDISTDDDLESDSDVSSKGDDSVRNDFSDDYDDEDGSDFDSESDYDEDDDFDEDEDEADLGHVLVNIDTFDSLHDDQSLTTCIQENWDDGPGSQETWDDELSSEISSREGDAFIDADDIPEPAFQSTFAIANSSNVSPEDLAWLQNMGFSTTKALEALKQCRGRHRLEALRWLYARALEEPNHDTLLKDDPLLVFGVTEKQIQSTRSEEKMVLDSVYAGGFDGSASQCWKLKVFTEVLKPFCRKSYPSAFLVEVHFPPGSRYPYEPPVVVFRDESQSIPPKFCLIMSLRLQRNAKSWVGEPMVFSIVSSIESNEARNILANPPSAFTDLIENETTANSRSSVVATSKSISLAISSSKSKPVSRPTTPVKKNNGPAPRYSQLSRGVGVAVTLKEDQGTDRTVEGFVQDSKLLSLSPFLSPSSILIVPSSSYRWRSSAWYQGSTYGRPNWPRSIFDR
jgi:hypothetical protein